ncbi:MAG: aldo/keto reductase [Tepidisphaeraceae bacterium]
MRKQTLGKTGLELSALGFGCVRLTAHSRPEEAIEILNTAYNSGITHFDVARLYGFGRAEGILGQFLKGKRQSVTVATKFGLSPPAGLVGKRWMVNAVKKALGPFPGLLRVAKRRASQKVETGVFSPAAAQQSLETSLRELGTDYVDLLLLHECSIADATNPELLAMLQRQIAAGKVRSVGVASEFGKLPPDAALLADFLQIIQFNHNAQSRNLPRWRNVESRGIVTHSIFGPARPLAEAIRARPELARRFSSDLNLDLSDPLVINSLLLHYNLQSNAGGAVLFSSTDAAHVKANARSVDSDHYDQRQISGFIDFVDQMLGSGAPSNLQATDLDPVR